MKLTFCPFSAFLFGASAVAYTYNRRKIDSSKTMGCESCTPKDKVSELSKFRVVFVIGGPGAGKGTQCSLLSKKLGWSHLSAGDVLRTERNSGSKLADIINSKILSGQIVPSSITVNLLKKEMERIFQKTKNTKFLIDGFPRSQENSDEWDKVFTNNNVAKVEFVLFLDCPEDIMTGRILERGKTSGRDDDNLEVIRKRFKTFREESATVLDIYSERQLVKTVVADNGVEDIYSDVEKLFTDL